MIYCGKKTGLTSHIKVKRMLRVSAVMKGVSCLADCDTADDSAVAAMTVKDINYYYS